MTVLASVCLVCKKHFATMLHESKTENDRAVEDHLSLVDTHVQTCHGAVETKRYTELEDFYAEHPGMRPS